MNTNTWGYSGEIARGLRAFQVMKHFSSLALYLDCGVWSVTSSQPYVLKLN